MNRSPLDSIRIATPCPVGWDQMKGNNRVRHCDLCHLNVYNISELNRSDAESLLASTEGRICARLYRRIDGTIITQDCPVGLRAVRRRISKAAAAVFAILSSLSSVVLGQGQSKHNQKYSCQTRITRKDLVSQSQETTISGLVLDPVGAVVPSAQIVLENTLTKSTQKTFSNQEGQFHFVGMLPGEYAITIKSPGFAPYLIKDLELKQHQATDIAATLFFKSETEWIGIVAESDFRDIPPGTRIINERMIRSLPY